MKRLSRERVIEDIEFIIRTPMPPAGSHQWIASGAHCQSARHSFSGEIYQFNTEVVYISFPASGKASWKIMLVVEYWHLGEGEQHAHRWIKLLAGNKASVIKWVSESRDQKLLSQAPTVAP